MAIAQLILFLKLSTHQAILIAARGEQNDLVSTHVRNKIN